MVGVLDGVADLQEEVEALGGVEAFLVAPFVDRESIDVLHDDVRAAVVGGAAIEEAGNIGVIEGGDNLPFAAEALEDAVRLHAAVDDFDGDLFVVGFVGAVGEINGTHATAAEGLVDGVGADAGGDRFSGFGGSVGKDFRKGRDGRGVEELLRGGVRTKEFADLCVEFSVGAAGAFEEGGALFHGLIEDQLE